MSLTSISIPASVTYISEAAFVLPCLESIYVESGNTEYISVENCLIRISDNAMLLGCKYSVIPDYVTSIALGAFVACIELTNIVIPNSITSIGDWAFASCLSLTSVVISNSVLHIGYEAFTGAYEMTIYVEEMSKPIDWDDYWYNDYYISVIWGCTLSGDKTYVVSFDTDNIVYQYGYGYINEIYHPYREGYIFCGWSTSEDSDIAEYYYPHEIIFAPSGITLYAIWEEGCNLSFSKGFLSLSSENLSAMLRAVTTDLTLVKSGLKFNRM